MGTTSHRIGRAGERRAALWLRMRGYRILTTGFRAAGGELDIVASRGGTLHIVEVKTRRGAASPADALTPEKRRRILRATRALLAHGPVDDGACARVSFDLLEVRRGRWWTTVRLRRDWFRADDHGESV